MTATIALPSGVLPRANERTPVAAERVMDDVVVELVVHQGVIPGQQPEMLAEMLGRNKSQPQAVPGAL
ncbi:MAG: hypothetical protein J2P50_00965 [Hyphomicrobiaceae bacterium]|nr:hypothetical protein [Hyphomicrobiaceae bacterium]